MLASAKLAAGLICPASVDDDGTLKDVPSAAHYALMSVRRSSFASLTYVKVIQPGLMASAMACKHRTLHTT